MTERLNTIFNSIPACDVFADIGCDHGYVAKAMLDSGKAQKVIVSDVSAKCLKKAELLLSDYIANGRAESKVSDGFDKIDFCSVALIAGMGGEEIISILSKARSLPEKLILQPMKNCDKVRYFVVQNGYRIERDFVFKAGGKFYDLMSLTKGKDKLTEEQAEFGKDNLLGHNTDFIEMISYRINKYSEYLKDIPDGEKKEELNAQIEKLKKYV
ncbi:MAG: SAM-dependent methyltransferase [Clostridia bacterium]|nr:SAM-dependent methyltransferase [Clostridia bacterium]